ncbi:MAG: Major facilitator superfamily [Candidatus Gottesmanbacteria bacterium GW2011_GWA1_48_13]|uniref:Major facilitator superfamily n=1 Tax=Candidatus Gottesmanbacteria bacterium GW2011_GWA1_48_13 TaxID=1618439 RepID=A0A0G1UN46_9BACT|nr:MAG: Major facilitator superfamily [Candidatus Gottesmanbacteria bacterium GW2011_GWA1_48_13]
MEQKKYFGFPRNVLILSIVSFLNDIGGETVKRTIPLYLANVLGVKTTIIGLIEGVGEAVPHLLQPIAGNITDRTQKRKPLIVAGQALRSSMLLLFFATSWPMVLLLRFLDRSGKGVTTAPRDALISISSRGHAGRAFGLNRALDNAGAVVGMVAATIIIVAVGRGAFMMSTGVFRSIVLLAAVPLVISLLLLVFFIRDVPVVHHHPRWVLHNQFGHKYYLFLFFSFLFALGNSSDAFLILKAQGAGLTLWQIFLLLAGYSLVSSLSGFPLANLSDRVGRKKLLVAGWFLYSLVYFLFAQANAIGLIVGLFFIYGLYYGCTEGAAKALVSDIVDQERQGTAYGVYNMVVGVTLLPASLLAGFLWQTFAPSVAFTFSAGTAFVAAIGLLVFL